MKLGKLNWDDLKKIIDDNRGKLREDVLIKSGIGEDCSVIDYGKYQCVLSTDPITGASNNIGKLAVHINANDIGSSGAELVGFLVTILAPPNTTLEEIKVVMNEISEEARSLNAEILGGHTEITDAVNRIVVSCTAVGKGKGEEIVATKGADINDDIIVTKELCLEGTSILVNDYYEHCKSFLTEQELNEANEYSTMLSVLTEGQIAGKLKVSSMHDITEGGVLGALYEVAEANNCGFKIYEDLLPITEISKKVCEYFKIDSKKFISSGSLLITCKNGNEVVEKLTRNKIKATIIGKITKSEKLIIINNEEVIVPPPENDELFNIKLQGESINEKDRSCK